MPQVLEATKALAELKQLNVRVYRGLHLNAANKDNIVIDRWIEQNAGSSADLEKLLNHIHIYDFFPDIQDEDHLSRLASELASSWQYTLSAIDERYRAVNYTGYGPEVTFYFDRSAQKVL